MADCSYWLLSRIVITDILSHAGCLDEVLAALGAGCGPMLTVRHVLARPQNVDLTRPGPLTACYNILICVKIIIGMRQVAVAAPFFLRSPYSTIVWSLGETPPSTSRLAYRQAGQDMFWYPLGYRHARAVTTLTHWLPWRASWQKLEPMGHLPISPVHAAGRYKHW